MSTQANRREVLIGAATVVVAAAMPGAATAEMSLAEQRYSAEWFDRIRRGIDVPEFFGCESAVSGALTVLSVAAPGDLSHEIYGDDMRRALAWCVTEGYATQTAPGRYRITEAGIHEREAIRIDDYCSK